MEYVYKLNLPKVEYYLQPGYDIQSQMNSLVTDIRDLSTVFDVNKFNIRRK